jgi:hypothetical protein
MVEMLEQEYNLMSSRFNNPLSYVTQFEVAYHSSNGKLKWVDKFELNLTLNPSDNSKGTEKFTCTKFSVQLKGGVNATIPSLEGWSYNFSLETLNKEGLDEQGLMFGIPHSKFENLIDSNGKKLSIEAQYQVYSAFIYFHSYCSQLADQSAKSLKKIGDQSINDLTGLESPVDLGKKFLNGSKFLHGIETLEFKGLGLIEGKKCAIIGFNETGGGYVMYIRPMPVLKVKTVGGTRYSGEMYIDLKSLNVKKVKVTIIDMTKTTMYGIPVEIAIPITSLTIKLVK